MFSGTVAVPLKHPDVTLGQGVSGIRTGCLRDQHGEHHEPSSSVRAKQASTAEAGNAASGTKHDHGKEAGTPSATKHAGHATGHGEKHGKEGGHAKGHRGHDKHGHAGHEGGVHMAGTGVGVLAGILLLLGHIFNIRAARGREEDCCD